MTYFILIAKKFSCILKFVDKKNIVNEMPTVTTQNQKLIHHGKNSLTNAIKRRWKTEFSSLQGKNCHIEKGRTTKKMVLKKGKSDRKCGVIINFVSKVCWHELVHF